jgi:hypothetical protein
MGFTVSIHDKNEKEKTSDTDDYTAFEQFIEWCEANKRALTIALSVVLFHTLIFAGIILAVRSGNSTDLQNPADHSHQTSHPTPEPAEEPAYNDEATGDNIENNSETPENDSLLSSAFKAGVQTGELFIESRDAVVDFFQGLNEATGASVWVRERWDSGRERVSRWFEENTAADEEEDTNLSEDNIDIADDVE